MLILWLSVNYPPPLESLGRLDERLIPEASGIAKSRHYPDIYWVHNDSGNPPVIFAIRGDGRIVGQFRLTVPNVDWEDIAADDKGHLYVGDIGNNGGLLPVRSIYRIDEPDPLSPPGEPLKASAVSFYFMPRSSRFDAEGMVVEDRSATLVAKYLDGREAELFSVPLEPPAPLARPATPRLTGRLPGFSEPATGAALNKDRTLLAVCSATITRVYRREESQSPAWQLSGEVRYESLPIEGITWDGRDLVLVAEGGGFYRVAEKAWRVPLRGKSSPRPEQVEKLKAAKPGA
jgi:hypothetical protein